MYNIGILKGDGIGPEIMDQAIKLLACIQSKYQLDMNIEFGLFGGEAIDQVGHPFPETTRTLVDGCDAVLLGAVGGPKWDKAPIRPEEGLLSLRKYMNVYCNLRPVFTFESLKDMSPVKLEGKVDLCFVRELTGGIYFGEKSYEETVAYDVERYTQDEIKRIAWQASELAGKRNGHVTSIDKSNVLSSSKLWRKTVDETIKDVDVEHMYVDNAAMQLILNPGQFDVVLTNNIFGDILSDEASVLTGSIGVLPSASVGDEKALYEPIHGSAPDIAGQDIANPIGMILSVAMMFQHSFGRTDIHDDLYKQVEKTLEQGYGTIDLKLHRPVTTSEWTDRLIENIEK